MFATGKLMSSIATNKRMRFDGVDDYMDLNILPDEIMETGVFDISFDMFWESSNIASYDRIIMGITTTGFARLQRNSGGSTFEFWARKSAGNNIVRESFNLTPDVAHTVRLVGDGVDLDILVDGVIETSGALATTHFHTPTWTTLTLSSDASTLQGSIWNWSITTASVTQFLLGKGNLASDWLDQSGNGNEVTIYGSPEATYI